jgi:hypothetical protein
VCPDSLILVHEILPCGSVGSALDRDDSSTYTVRGILSRHPQPSVLVPEMRQNDCWSRDFRSPPAFQRDGENSCSRSRCGFEGHERTLWPDLHPFGGS